MSFTSSKKNYRPITFSHRPVNSPGFAGRLQVLLPFSRSPGFIKFSLCFPLSFSRGFLITKMIDFLRDRNDRNEMTFFMTKFFVSLSMIIIVINCLSNMTFFAGILFINSRNSRDLPVFGQISLFFSAKKSEISRF